MWELKVVRYTKASHLLLLRASIMARTMQLCTHLILPSHHVTHTQLTLHKPQSLCQFSHSHQSAQPYIRRVQWHLWPTLGPPPRSILCRQRLLNWVRLGVLGLSTMWFQFLKLLQILMSFKIQLLTYLSPRSLQLWSVELFQTLGPIKVLTCLMDFNLIHLLT